MHSDDAARKDDADRNAEPAPAPLAVAEPREPQKPASPPSPRRRARTRVRSGLSAFRSRTARLVDYLAIERERRRNASILLALALNALLFTALAVFGRFHIFIPGAPKDSISIVMVELPTDSVLPEPVEPETLPEPELAPEPIKEPEIEPEPAPDPVPEPAPELAPEPEPEPTVDLTPEETFAPPAEEEEAPFVAEPEPVPSEELALPAESAAAPLEAPGEQAPAEEAPPLTQAAPEAPSELEVTERGDEEEEKKDEEETPSGDDMFDEAPVFSRPRMALPKVDLPKGEQAISPGESGLVAIDCNKEFSNKEKAAECAGRTEIRSGWRPGLSKEDWSEATRLLKKERMAGRTGVSPTDIYGPEVGGAMEDAAAVEALKDFRKSQDGVNKQAADSSDNLNRTLGQPDIGPEAVEPSWTLRDDPLIDREDAEKLRKALEEAEKKKQAPEED
jgi:hypothetical protein